MSSFKTFDNTAGINWFEETGFHQTIFDPDKPVMISPDHLKNWSRCQKKFQYQYIDRLNWPTDQKNFGLGRDVHKLMDYNARGLDLTQMMDVAEPNVRNCTERLINSEWGQLPVVASEWAFHVPFYNIADRKKPVWLTGRVDRISRDGDRLIIIDWKTGTAAPKNPDKDWQTIVYCYALSRCAGQLGFENIKPEQIEMHYVEVKPDGTASQPRAVSVQYSSPRFQADELSIQSHLSSIVSATSFSLPAKCPDRYCPYDTVCGIKEASS